MTLKRELRSKYGFLFAEQGLSFALCQKSSAKLWPPRDAAKALFSSINQIDEKSGLELLKTQKVQLVYGNEKNGLSNEELNKCHAAALIPASKEYSSLNLAHAVAVSICLLYTAAETAHPLSLAKPSSFYPKPGEFEAFLTDLRITLKLLGYQNNDRNDLLPRVYEHFKNFFRRSGLDRKDLHLFHSLISRTHQRVKPS